MWIDSHAHLNDEAFQDDCQEVLKAAVDGGVGTIIVVGCDLDSSRKAVAMAQENKMVRAAVGIHPHDAKHWDLKAKDEILAMLKDPRVVAVGEIGLDYHYNYSSKEDQLKAFKEQLEIAKQYNKPVIIHNREAHQDTVSILHGERIGGAGGVMHCFSGSLELAVECLKMGLYVSFAGPLTFPNAEKLRKVAVEIPLDKVLVETDCPYLSPHPFRGKRNEPVQVGLVGRKLAELKGLPVEEIMQATTGNCQRLFGINITPVVKDTILEETKLY